MPEDQQVIQVVLARRGLQAALSDDQPLVVSRGSSEIVEKAGEVVVRASEIDHS
jgi:hypothetical protein